MEGSPLASLSVSRIVEEAGVSRATFYLHFPDKQALIERLAEEQMAKWRSLGSSLLDNPGFTRQELEQSLSQIVAVWRAEGEVLGALIEVAEYDEDAHEIWTGVVGAIGLEVAQVLKVRRAALSDGEADYLGMTVVWMIERSCHEMLGPDPREDGLLVSALTDAVWRITAAD